MSEVDTAWTRKLSFESHPLPLEKICVEEGVENEKSRRIPSRINYYLSSIVFWQRSSGVEYFTWISYSLTGRRFVRSDSFNVSIISCGVPEWPMLLDSLERHKKRRISRSRLSQRSVTNEPKILVILPWNALSCSSCCVSDWPTQFSTTSDRGWNS